MLAASRWTVRLAPQAVKAAMVAVAATTTQIRFANPRRCLNIIFGHTSSVRPNGTRIGRDEAARGVPCSPRDAAACQLNALVRRLYSMYSDFTRPQVVSSIGTGYPHGHVAFPFTVPVNPIAIREANWQSTTSTCPSGEKR
jgi:hypothetical protein